jgi:hypothetical protein
VADDLSELLLVVCECPQFFSSLLGTDNDFIACNLGVGFLIDIDNIAKLFDPTVSLFKFSGWVNFQHLIGSSPIKINPRGTIDRDNYCELQQLIITLFVLRQMHLNRFESGLKFSRGINFPAINEFAISVFVGGKDGGEAVARLYFFDHRWYLD